MPDESSSAFDQLAQPIRRWIWQQQWHDLRDVQEQAIAPILKGLDVLISSPTASGKTEAAFLPICSALIDKASCSLGVVYIAPLKALINDQRIRLEQLFECVGSPVTPWHGDINVNVKRRFVERPRGALLITPESMEALFITRGSAIPRIVEHLRFIVIDELHSFIGMERGRQLQTLMHRIELAAQRRVSRIGLSATLGDPGLAAEFLRPRCGEQVEQIASTELGREVQLLVRGYRRVRPSAPTESADQGSGGRQTDGPVAGSATGDDLEISRHLFETLRGGTNVVFANQRRQVELFADLLRRRAERATLPNEFWPHHGNLSREIREDAEEFLRGTRPATVVATTTLELGIDIGAVDSIAQIGAPSSVSSLVQRLGRSGRKPGAPSVIRIYIQEHEIVGDPPPNVQLRVSLVQTVAMVRLLQQRWVESPPPNALHLSTLVQQVLSLAAQHGGFQVVDAYRALCSSGPFDAVDQSMFAQLLRDLAGHELVTQNHDGTLVLDMLGERLVNHYDFYAAFTSPEEWRLVAKAKLLGTLPVTFPLVLDSFLIFAGRRWRIVGVDERRREVRLERAAGGLVPRFHGSGGLIHDRVREEMRQVFADDDLPIFLDRPARELLAEGRETFRRINLGNESLFLHGRDTYIFPWVGDRTLNTLALRLRAQGAKVYIDRPALVLRDTSPTEVRQHLMEIASTGRPDAKGLAASVSNKRVEKHHTYLSEDLLNADYVSSQLDENGAWQTVMRLCSAFTRS